MPITLVVDMVLSQRNLIVCSCHVFVDLVGIRFTLELHADTRSTCTLTHSVRHCREIKPGVIIAMNDKLPHREVSANLAIAWLMWFCEEGELCAPGLKRRVMQDCRGKLQEAFPCPVSTHDVLGTGQIIVKLALSPVLFTVLFVSRNWSNIEEVLSDGDLVPELKVCVFAADNQGERSC